jgi:crotonobetainyl-CoA:carnitine CoA-transferase CaiB-like acyl-CoA transferase
MAEDLTAEKYLDRKYQRVHMDHIVATIQKWALTKTKAELFHEGQKRGAEIGPLNTVPEVLADPQLAARGFWHEVDHPELGKSGRYSGVPYRFTKSPCQMRRRAPHLGEDNEAIYIHELGLSKEELIMLKEWKVV